MSSKPTSRSKPDARSPKRTQPIKATPSEATARGAGLGDEIRRARSKGKSVAIALPGSRKPVPLPDPIVALVADALDAHARGQRVQLAVQTVHVDAGPAGTIAGAPCHYLILDRDPNDEITTQQAAAALRVSRPTIIKAIDDGRLAARMVGKHRRVRIYDFNAYAQAAHAARMAHGMESTRREQELGLHEIAPIQSIDEWRRVGGRVNKASKPASPRSAGRRRGER